MCKAASSPVLPFFFISIFNRIRYHLFKVGALREEVKVPRYPDCRQVLLHLLLLFRSFAWEYREYLPARRHGWLLRFRLRCHGLLLRFRLRCWRRLDGLIHFLCPGCFRPWLRLLRNWLFGRSLHLLGRGGLLYFGGALRRQWPERSSSCRPPLA